MSAWVTQKFVQSLFKSYSKARGKVEKAGQKIRFSFNTFFETFYARDGQQRRALWDMMSYSVWIDFAQSRKGGEYTESEAKEMWQRWLVDASVPRDWDGPRGQLQLKIRVGTRIEAYQDVGREKGIHRSEKLSKNPLWASLGREVPERCWQHWHGETRLPQLEAMKQQADKAFASSGANPFSEEGICAPDVQGMVEASDAKNRQVGPLQEAGDEEESSDREEGEKGDDEDSGASAPEGQPAEAEESDSKPRAKPGKKPTAWIDMEKHVNKAHRTFFQQYEAQRNVMQDTLAQVQELMADFRKVPSEAAQFGTELELVQKRAVWLEARKHDHVVLSRPMSQPCKSYLVLEGLAK